MQKKQKIKPENSKLKNYLKTMFRSPSRSLFKLNSRTAATSFFSVFFDVFNLRAVWREIKGTFVVIVLLRILKVLFSFALMQKKQKIKPENQKRKNYLKAPFRRPSRSP